MKIPIIEVLPNPMPFEEYVKEISRLNEKWKDRRFKDIHMSADNRYCVFIMEDLEI